MQWGLPSLLAPLLFPLRCLAAPPEPLYNLPTATSARFTRDPASLPLTALSRSHSAPARAPAPEPALVRATRPQVEADLVRARQLLHELRAGPGVHIRQERERLQKALARGLERLRRRLYVPRAMRDGAAAAAAARGMADLFGAYLHLATTAQREVPDMVAQMRRQRGKGGHEGEGYGVGRGGRSGPPADTPR